MNLAHKIRLVPTPEQETYFKKACGINRFSYNWALAKWNEDYEAGLKPNANKLDKEFNKIKKTEYPWTAEVTKNASQRAILNVGTAFKRYFKKEGGKPKFKKKYGSKDSFYLANTEIKLDGKKVRVPKLGWVKMREELRFKGEIQNAVVSRSAHKWHIAIAVKTYEEYEEKPDKPATGVDLGISALATLSNGVKIEGPKPYKHLERRLARLNRRMHKKKLGSNNRRKAKEKVARLHDKIACIRNDALHKLTHYLTDNFGKIAIENLNVAGMVKNRRMAKSIMDMGWGEFKRQLDYKAVLKFCEIGKVDRFFPSSKMCSGCGNIKKDLTLNDRVYRCGKCGLVIDRDMNAAINILEEAFKEAKDRYKRKSKKS